MNYETYSEDELLTIKDLKLLILTSAGLVAQWITRLTTDQKIPGSNPGKVDFLMTKYNATQMNKSVASVGIEPATLALLAPRSNQLS